VEFASYSLAVGHDNMATCGEGSVMHINEIVKGLLEPHPELVPLQQQELIIRLAMWLRFPSEPDVQEAACLAGFLSYVNSKFPEARICDLPDGERSLLQRTIRVSHLGRILSGNAFEIPEFELFREYDDGPHDYLYVADIVKFLIWYAPDSKDKRDQASLQKAYFFIKKEGFEYYTDWSRRLLVKKWSLYKDASAILYVNYYYSDMDLMLDPRSPEFRSAVDAVTSQSDAVRTLLLQAKWVGERITARLHGKAGRTLALPVFPHAAKSIALPTVALGEYVYQALGQYDPAFDENTM
jgi:hypothetical protein